MTNKEEPAALKQRMIDSCKKQINSHGIKGFTMDDLCKDLSISKKTIYKHFKSKDDLIQAYLKYCLEDNITRTMLQIEREPTLQGKIESALISHHKYALPLEVLENMEKNHPEGWLMMEEQRQFKIKLFTDLVEAGVASGEFRGDINWDVLALILEKSTSALLDFKFLQQHNLNVNKALAEMQKIILGGIVLKR